MEIGILFTNYGPYHLARIEACQVLCKTLNWDVVGIELARSDNSYDWVTDIQSFPVKIFTIFGEKYQAETFVFNQFIKINKALSDLELDVLVVAGYSETAILLALFWAICNRKPSILMSASKEDDEVRWWWREALKKWIIKMFKSALVGGKPQKRYLIKLGMLEESVFTGYNVVGIDSFCPKQIQALPMPVQQPYFLAVNRFIPKKNLIRLVEAYALYRAKMRDSSWDLVICGDGILRAQIEEKISLLGLEQYVHLPGFLQQKDALPYFAHAKCFVHSSTQEQWGLVVNEAMAAGLPVLVSNRCGCYEDLIVEGLNGFGFDPENVYQMTDLMVRMHLMDIVDLHKMGYSSLEHIQKFSPKYFAEGLVQAIKYSLPHHT
jgi:1,2-diacylglycerol 3-alpha-glucosyltransferase